MQIVFVTDVHGNREGLEMLLQYTDADIYIIAGDLLYSAFFDYERMMQFTELQSQVRQMQVRQMQLGMGGQSPNLYAYAQQQNIEGALKDEAKSIVERFLQLSDIAVADMRVKYESFSETVSIKPRSHVYFLPGNYDMDLRQTAIARFNLHQHVVNHKGCVIAGYGGAPVFTPGIPDHVGVTFVETDPTGAQQDAHHFLQNANAHVVVTHSPPAGTFDRLPSGKQVGSIGITSALETSTRTKLAMCGHMHHQWGVKSLGGVWVTNPSNFGQVVEPNGYQSGGWYAQIELDESRDYAPRSIELMRLERARVHPVVEWIFSADKAAQPTMNVLNAERRKKLDDRIVFTEIEAWEDQPHIEEIELFNSLKVFFRRFETEETEKRIGDLRNIAESVEEMGGDIAFDILGSANFGMSDERSDVDAVLYVCDLMNNPGTRPGVIPKLADALIANRYILEIAEVIDLDEIERAIIAEEIDNESVQRFVIYRAIGRPVNIKLLRQYDDLLDARPHYRRQIEARARDALRMLIGTVRHAKSFDKYVRRLSDAGVYVPPSIRERLHRYLHQILEPDGFDTPQ